MRPGRPSTSICIMRHKIVGRRGAPLGPHADRSVRPSGLAARIIAARLRRGLSQARAASQLGVGRATLARWELGRKPRGLYRAALDAWLKKGGARD